MKITTLIVDDEKAAREGLSLLCADFPKLEVIGTCKDGIEAIDSIRSHQPQLVLLDVEMPRVDGFEVLASIPSPLPQIIFITAHDQYAVQAFEINAVDYILKPFSDERFEKAISRAVDEIATKKKQQLNPILETRRGKTNLPNVRASDEQRLVVKSDGTIQMISKSEIVQIEAFDYYVKIHLTDRFFLVRETMKNMEEQLQDSSFMRTHKSHIVNKEFIQSLAKSGSQGYEIQTTTGQNIRISRSKVAEVKEWLS